MKRLVSASSGLLGAAADQQKGESHREWAERWSGKDETRKSQDRFVNFESHQGAQTCIYLGTHFQKGELGVTKQGLTVGELLRND